MKSVFKIMLQYLKRNKRNAFIVLLCIILSVVLIVTVLSFCLALIDIQACAAYRLYSEDSLKTHEEILQKVYTNDEYIANIGLGILLTGTAVLIGISSISGALALNHGEKAKTVAAISALGAERRHYYTLLLSDAVLLSVAGIPLGMFLGILLSDFMVSYLNEFVIVPKGFDKVILLDGNAVFWSVIIIIISMLTILFACFGRFLGKRRSREIDIVKSYDSINISLKPKLLDKLFEKLFGIYGILASGNYQNHKNRFRRFSLSVSLSAILFITISVAFKYFGQLQLRSDDIDIINAFAMFFYMLIFAVFVITLISSSATLYADFLKRKCEFAMLKSIGIEECNMYRIVIIENLYYGIYMLVFVLIGGFAGNRIVFGILSSASNRIDYVYPWTEIIIAFAVILFLTVCISLAMTRITKKVNIVSELKNIF